MLWWLLCDFCLPYSQLVNNDSARLFGYGWCISFSQQTPNWRALSTSFSPTQCLPMSPAVCGGWVLVFMQVLQLDLCYRSPHGHTADWLTSLEYFFSLFTLASQVWALLRAILKVLNFCHFDSCGDPHQGRHIDTHSFSIYPKHTRAHTHSHTQTHANWLTHSVKYP